MINIKTWKVKKNNLPISVSWGRTWRPGPWRPSRLPRTSSVCPPGVGPPPVPWPGQLRTVVCPWGHSRPRAPGWGWGCSVFSPGGGEFGLRENQRLECFLASCSQLTSQSDSRCRGESPAVTCAPSSSACSQCSPPRSPPGARALWRCSPLACLPPLSCWSSSRVSPSATREGRNIYL